MAHSLRPRRHPAFARRVHSRDTSESRCGRAALRVLRTIDRLDIERFGPVDLAALERCRLDVTRLLQGIPHGVGETMHLEGLPESAAGPSRGELGVVGHRYELGLALRIYALNRRDQERFDEALDVLDTAWRVLEAGHEGFAAALERAELFTLLGRPERAAAVYRRLADRPSRDERRQLRLALAELALARGRYADAKRAFGAVRGDARRARDAVVERDAEWGLGRLLLAQGRPAEAVQHLWRVVNPGGHWEAYVDLARAAEAVGAWDPALRLAAHVTLSPPPTVRWQALAVTLRLTARTGDGETFDGWRDVAERWHRKGQPSPSYEVEAWLAAARGAAHLRGVGAALPALRRAREVSRRAMLPGVGARVRETTAAIRAGRPLPATAAGPLPPEVRLVTRALARYADARGMVEMASGEFGKRDRED